MIVPGHRESKRCVHCGGVLPEDEGPGCLSLAATVTALMAITFFSVVTLGMWLIPDGKPQTLIQVVASELRFLVGLLRRIW